MPLMLFGKDGKPKSDAAKLAVEAAGVSTLDALMEARRRDFYGDKASGDNAMGDESHDGHCCDSCKHGKACDGESRNCGDGAGGFKPGNTCAAGAGGLSVSSSESKDEWGKSTYSVSGETKKIYEYEIEDKKTGGHALLKVGPYRDEKADIIGTAVKIVSWYAYPMGHVALHGKASAEKEYTGKGFGRNVIATTLDIAKQHGAEYVTVFGPSDDTVKVMEHYTKKGLFTPVPSSKAVNGDFYTDFVINEKDGRSMSSRDCGTGAGGFKIGNTCAAGSHDGDGSTATQEEPAPAATKIVGHELIDDAHRSMFGEKPTGAGEYLSRHGWTGDVSGLDAWVGKHGASLNENQKRGMAATVAGIALAGSHYPDIRGVPITGIAVSEHVANTAKEFLDDFKARTGREPTGIESMQVYEQLSIAQATAGFYNSQTDLVTIVGDNMRGDADAARTYGVKHCSSPSPMHVGYHEMMHAVHFHRLRKSIGLAESGPITRPEFESVIARFKRGLEDGLKANGSVFNGLKTKDLAKATSEYGASHPLEAVTEYLTGVSLGGKRANKTLDLLMDISNAPRPVKLSAADRKLASAANKAARALAKKPSKKR